MSSVLPKSIDSRELPNSLSSNISSTTQILNPENVNPHTLQTILLISTSIQEIGDS